MRSEEIGSIRIRIRIWRKWWPANSRCSTMTPTSISSTTPMTASKYASFSFLFLVLSPNTKAPQSFLSMSLLIPQFLTAGFAIPALLSHFRSSRSPKGPYSRPFYFFILCIYIVVMFDTYFC